MSSARNERGRVVGRHVVADGDRLCVVLAAVLDLLNVRRAGGLEDSVLARFVDAEFMECIDALGVSRLHRLDICFRGSCLRDPLLDVSPERNHLGLPSSNPLPASVCSQRHTIDLPGSPNDYRIISGNPGEGRVSTHRRGDDAQVVGQAVPDIPQGTSLQVPGQMSTYAQ